MEIEIANKIKIRNAPSYLLDFLVKTLTIPNPIYADAMKNNRSTHGIEKFLYNFNHIYNGVAIPRGCRSMLFSKLAEEKIDSYKLIDNRKLFESREIDSSIIQYRPYQLKPVQELITRGEEGILVAPPGSGKTVIGLSILPMFGQPTLWLTHTNRLASQAVERAEQFLALERKSIGAIGGGKWTLGDILTVALVQTLARRETLKELYDQFGLVIVDEAHHCPSTTFLKVVNQLNPYYLYGLTATPYRRDKLETVMFHALGEATAVISSGDVEKVGGIVLPKVLYRDTNLSPKSNIAMGNNQARMISYLIENKKRNHMIVSDVIREATLGNYCIVVSDRKIHCETLHELISAGWEKTGIATGSYSRKYQDEQVRKFYDNEITVLVTTFALLGEGFDVDFLNRAFITTPFRAEGKVEQLIGRIQRSAEGKEDALVYDYVDFSIGVAKDQFESMNRHKDCRHRAYTRLGMDVKPYST